ncbi:pilus assembly FimT family protein [Fastidiosibacter lacustris]|uniref:pilus assembly FimT family protein n=1 Tax=Fastidiosibacter lacustris TaxID=2056695 RepID=UPI000E356A9B|nr:hypothetical protein [Fastidiosibacter lacustris]
MYIFSKKLNCVRVRHKEQGYILISLMASLVILGLIAISEYMQLVKKQQLERAETAANNIIHIAYTIGDAIYEPMAMIQMSSTTSEQDNYKKQANDIKEAWKKESRMINGEITLKQFYQTDNLSAVCGITHPPVSSNITFPSCLEANKPHNRFSQNNGNFFCQCTSQQIEKFPFLNMDGNVFMQPIGLANNETPKSVLLRVPYPERGGKVDTGLALRMIAYLKKNLIHTPGSKFAICAGKLKKTGMTRTEFRCKDDIESNDVLDPSVVDQFIYIDIARR